MRIIHHDKAEDLDEGHLESLVTRTRDGDLKAWAGLWLALAPLVETIAGRSRVTGRLARCPDERADIVVRVMGGLREDGDRRLAELRGRLACRDGSWRRWLWRVAVNAAVDHVREHPEYLGRVEEGRSRWVELTPDLDALEDERPDPIQGICGGRVLAGAREVLRPEQLDALCGWLRGDDPAEMAAALGLAGGATAATRLVRSAIDRLRNRLAGGRRRARGENRPVRLTDRPRNPSCRR